MLLTVLAYHWKLILLLFLKINEKHSENIEIFELSFYLSKNVPLAHFQCVDNLILDKNDDVKHNFSTLLARCYVVTSFCNI